MSAPFAEESLLGGLVANVVVCWPTAGPKERIALLDLALSALVTLGAGPVPSAATTPLTTEALLLCLSEAVEALNWTGARFYVDALALRAAR